MPIDNIEHENADVNALHARCSEKMVTNHLQSLTICHREVW